MPLRRRPQGPRPPDARGVQPLPGRLRRGEHQHRRARSPPALRRLRRQGHRLHHPEARPRARRKQQAQQAAREERQATYKEQLEPLRDKRMVFIFDECHRSQFGDNHQAIKEFFPNAQLFGFTGTPIFEDNATVQADRGRRADAARPRKDLFQQRAARLHDHPRHRGPERPALPRRLLQARRQDRPQAGRDARQARRRRCHPRQARRRHRRPHVQRASSPPRRINDAIEYYEPVQDAAGRERRPPIPSSSR